MSTYDFSKLLQDAKAGGAWPLGDYDFEVVDTSVKASSNGSGNEMIVTKFRCLVGPYANKSITNNFVLVPDNPTALNIFFRNMAAFGLGDDFFAQIGNGDLNPIAHALRGKRARITLGHREWNGAKQNDIKSINPITDGLSNVTMGPQGAAPATPMAAPPPPPPQAAQSATAPPPPPPPAAAVPPPVPVAAPAPAPVAAPAPPPPPPAPVAPAPAPAPVATVDTPPAGYTQELWDSIPEAAKQAIRAAAQPAVPAMPPPPPLPV